MALLGVGSLGILGVPWGSIGAVIYIYKYIKKYQVLKYLFLIMSARKNQSKFILTLALMSHIRLLQVTVYSPKGHPWIVNKICSKFYILSIYSSFS